MLENYVKKLGFSLVLASAFGVSVNAACESAFCFGGNVGVGGVYSDFGGNTDSNANFMGGYGALDVKFLILKRLQLGLGAKAGGGSMGISGATLSSLPNNTNAWFGDFSAKIGFNMAGTQSPLFINITANVMDEVSNSLIRGIGIFGGELEGRASLSEKVGLLYSIGGGAAMALYNFEGKSSNFIHPIGDKWGYAIFGSIGMDYALTSNLGLYVKAIGKFYDVAASQTAMLNNVAVSFPAASSWSAMLETGLSF